VKRPSCQRQLEYIDRIVDLNILRQKRKSLAIHILSDGQPVELRVPLRCPWSEIESFLESRLDWIHRAVLEVASRPREIPPGFKDREIHYFLGKPYPLKLSKGKGKVSVCDGFLNIQCSNHLDEEKVSKQLDKFYKSSSLAIYEERIEVCVADFPVFIRPSGLRVRKMKSRWGSCSQNGEICLNTLLIQKPLAAIDFVITHELCHLIHFGHNKKFYALLDRAMPSWRESELLLSSKSEPFQHFLF